METLSASISQSSHAKFVGLTSCDVIISNVAWILDIFQYGAASQMLLAALIILISTLPQFSEFHSVVVPRFHEI